MRIVSVLLLALCACATARPARQALAPLRNEGELHVYVLPSPHEADRLAFTVDTVAAVRQDGTSVPLEVMQRSVIGTESHSQRLLAWGRVPPGDYAGIALKPASATLEHEEEKSNLLIDESPARVELGFPVQSENATVMWLTLKPTESVTGDVKFTPAFSAIIAPQTPPQVALYCPSQTGASVTVVDRGEWLVSGIIAVGARPRGFALDRLATRAYVSLAREDQIDILDLAANRSVGRIRLSPGDEPGELAFAADGTLVVVNERSRTVSFVDPLATTEISRVTVGDAPTSLLIDRSGRFAYVANRGSGTISVIDLANRVVFATLATEPEPLRMGVSRDGSRLYVVHRGSQYLGVFALPSLTPMPKAFVSLGATTVRVDARSDLIYLSRGGERRISVYDPIAFQLVDQFDVPGAVSYMAIDDAENALLALMPDRRSIAVIDLTNRRVLEEIPVGPDPYIIALSGERF